MIGSLRGTVLERTEAGTVFSYLPVRVGDTLNDEKAAEAIRSLFATGFFRDVTIEVDGDVMVVQLLERPSSVSNIFIVNLKAHHMMGPKGFCYPQRRPSAASRVKHSCVRVHEHLHKMF